MQRMREWEESTPKRKKLRRKLFTAFVLYIKKKYYGCLVVYNHGLNELRESFEKSKIDHAVLLQSFFKIYERGFGDIF